METIKDYSRAFQAMRFVAVFSVFSFVASTVFYYFQYRNIVDQHKEIIYVSTPNGTFQATQASQREVHPVEINKHSEQFIKTMFSHDAETYEERISKAMNLINKKDGVLIVAQFEGEPGKKKGVRDGYIRWGSRTEVTIDSIKTVSQGIMPQVRAYFKQQHFIGSELKSELSVALEYQVVDTYRSENNPYGLQITNLDFILHPEAVAAK
ncbi:hypothetical protein [Tunicatimonas pelagia]|uniref:hypothetical protein n=1 Tax=Tunicatimonas pelagia TaxID=931531 RepID=UPI002664F00E|nr:hypothetical protein [Tunicatimonas pelagia]WKN46478.1 hypothetical protein P0M28_30475 [Tunicatimonas pelagia]